MAGSVLTLYLNNPLQSGSSAGVLDLSQPVASTSTTGWTPGKTAIANYSRSTYGVKKAASTFGTTVQLSSGPDTDVGHLAEDCWRTSTATTGVFSAGTWYSSLSMIAVSSGGVNVRGAARFRIWRSSDVGGATPTEITQGTMRGIPMGSNMVTTAAISSSASTQIASFSLNNEFLFMQTAWEITQQGTSNTGDAVIRFGPITNNTNGTFLITSTFSATGGGGGGATPSGAGYWQRAQDWLDA